VGPTTWAFRWRCGRLGRQSRDKVAETEVALVTSVGPRLGRGLRRWRESFARPLRKAESVGPFLLFCFLIGPNFCEVGAADRGPSAGDAAKAATDRFAKQLTRCQLASNGERFSEAVSGS
jgi:hypothetical protein